MAYDATLTARIADYRRDPQRLAAVEKKYRVSDTSLEFTNAEFQDVARMGQIVEVNNEAFVEVSSYDGYAASTAQNILSSKQQFTIDQAAKWDVRLFDIDVVQTVDDIEALVLSNAAHQGARYMTRARFAAIAAQSDVSVLAEVDCSNAGAPAAPNQTDGNAIFTRLQEAYNGLVAQGMSPADLKAALPALASSNLFFAQYLQNNTDGQNALNEKGYVGTLNQTRLFSSIDTPKTEADYSATVKGAVAAGAHIVTVDGVVDGAGTPAAVQPMVNDRFTVSSKEYRVVQVIATATSGEWKLKLDRPVEAAIADNATLTVTGYTHEHIVFAAGKPLSSVVQRNFALSAVEEPEYFATRLKAMTLFGNFMTSEGARKCFLVPIKVRTFTSV